MILTKSMKKITFIIIIVLATLSIIHSLQSIYSLWSKQEVVKQAANELAKQEEKNTQLKQQLKAASAQDFVEEQARDKLFMVKPGENTIVIPAALLATDSAKKPIEVHKSNWQQWWDLFF